MNCIPYRSSYALSAGVAFETAFTLVRQDIVDMADRDLAEVSRHSWRIECCGKIAWREDGRFLATGRYLFDFENWEREFLSHPNAT